jgi:hypothetical protein
MKKKKGGSQVSAFYLAFTRRQEVAIEVTSSTPSLHTWKDITGLDGGSCPVHLYSEIIIVSHSVAPFPIRGSRRDDSVEIRW